MLDTLVGVTFVVVALGPWRVPTLLRAWWAAIAVSWWVGDVAPLPVLHQGVLIGALACFPSGAPRTVRQHLLLAAGALAATGLTGRPGAAVVLVAVGMLAPRRAIFVRVAALGLALWLAVAHGWSLWWPATYPTEGAFVGYELVLITTAVALPWGLAAQGRSRVALRERVLAHDPSGLAGLEDALREALGRPAIRVAAHDGGVEVVGLGTLDADTAQAVAEAVDAVASHEQALAESRRQIEALESARARLQLAADSERSRAAERLGRQRRVLSSCGQTSEVPEPVRTELAAAVADVDRIVAGLAPVGLGEGGLASSLRDLCARHPVPVTLACDPGAAGDLWTETALYYVCCEALANSAKHSHAATVEVSLESDGDALVLTVSDDGVGGATTEGSGLLTLRDRTAACGGELAVDSAGSGTRIEARLPQSIRTNGSSTHS